MDKKRAWAIGLKLKLPEGERFCKAVCYGTFTEMAKDVEDYRAGGYTLAYIHTMDDKDFKTDADEIRSVTA